MKLYQFIFLFSTFCHFQISFCQSSSKITKYLFYGISNAFSKIPDTTRSWYCDSTVIYEMKVNFSFSSTDSIYIAPKDEVFKYTFFDLRTFKYQDYESFTDTATPVSNYRYKPNGLPYIGEHFIKGATQKLNMNAAQMMADTMMNNKLYKRMSFKEVHKDSIGEYFNEEIYYFLCGGLTGAYHLIQPELEKLFPGCSNVRTDIYFTGPGSKITIISESFIARKLNKEEDQIFSKWKQNAIETKLPLLTQDEILKMKPFIPIKYKNHPLFNEMSN